MKRVVIIGSGGAGKSTLARRLGEILKLEVLHLDQLYWKPNWVEPPKDEWIQTVAGLLQKETWIMDGNFGGTMEMRLEACDTAIFLDFPRTICLYRVFKRWLKYRTTNRPDMTEGCNEKIDWEFLGWIWNFRKTTKPQIEERLQKIASKKTVIRLKSAREVENLFQMLNK
jgi:adenylate kinase family enzyme